MPAPTHPTSTPYAAAAPQSMPLDERPIEGGSAAQQEFDAMGAAPYVSPYTLAASVAGCYGGADGAYGSSAGAGASRETRRRQLLAELAELDAGGPPQRRAAPVEIEYDDEADENRKPSTPHKPAAAPKLPPPDCDFFASREEAASVLLRRTRYNTGAKHFAAGAIAVHIAEVALHGMAAGGGKKSKLPADMQLQVWLLGKPIHTFRVKAHQARSQTKADGDTAVVTLDESVVYEVAPDLLGAQLAANPMCEFRLLPSAAVGSSAPPASRTGSRGSSKASTPVAATCALATS